MADYGASHSKSKPQTSSLTSFYQWLQLKNYQYEITTSLYMLTPREKTVFNLILFTLVSMFCAAAYLYLPNHIYIISHRVYYYVMGELSGRSGTVNGLTHLVKKTAGGTAALAAEAAKQTVEKIAKRAHEL